MRSLRLTAAALLVLAACSDDDTTATATAGDTCGPEQAVEITFRVPAGNFEPQSYRTLIGEFNETHPDITVALEVPELIPTNALRPLVEGGQDAPTLEIVDPGLLLGLHDAGAIADLAGSCLTADDLALASRVVGPLGDIDGVHYGVPLGLNTGVLVYERAALDGIGVDEPPATLDELDTVLGQLSDAGYSTPLVWPEPALGVALGGPAWVDGDDVPADPDGLLLLERIRRMVTNGHLAVEPPAGTPGHLAPIGTDDVVMQVGENGTLWGLASSLASGQAPGLELALAPVPGLDGSSMAVGGFVHAVSSSATEDERAGATAFLAWMLEPAQQARLHLFFADVFPVNPAAAEHPTLEGYWDDLPLLREAYELLLEHAEHTALPWLPWPDRAHAAGTIRDALLHGDDPVGPLSEMLPGVESYFRDPARWIRCITGASGADCGPNDPGPLEEPEH